MEDVKEGPNFMFDSSNFSKYIVTCSDVYFRDFTPFVVKIDKEFANENRVLYFFRNRKMGKSLFLSCLDYYYNLLHEKISSKLFAKLIINDHKSPLKNKMIVLKLDFSRGLCPKNIDAFHENFNSYVNRRLEKLKTKYPKFLFEIQKNCEMTLEEMQDSAEDKGFKVLILIDEYDASLNRLLSRSEEIKKLKFNPTESDNVSLPFRNFFSALKAILQNSDNFYLVFTGLSPQSLNDFTSGFNIGKNIGAEKNYADMLGYPEKFVEEGIQKLNLPSDFSDSILKKLRDENNGYIYFYHPDTISLYNPAKINYALAHIQQNLQDNAVQNVIKNKNMKEFMFWIFNYWENKDTKPADSVLTYLTNVENLDNFLWKVLNPYQSLKLSKNICGPDLSFWNFNDEDQLISFLFYHGALTYAPVQTDSTEELQYFVRIPNKCAEMEYFDRLRKKVKLNANVELYELFQQNNISPLLLKIEAYMKENSKVPDIAQSKEDGLDWCIYTFLKLEIFDQVERQYAIKFPGKTFYADIVIFPKAFSNKIFVVEEKSVPFIKMAKPLQKYINEKYPGENKYLGLNSNDWRFLSQAYNQFFHEDNAWREEMNEIMVEIYNSSLKKTTHMTIDTIINEAKAQVKLYGSKLKGEFPEKEIVKFVVIRLGPSKLISYSVDN